MTPGKAVKLSMPQLTGRSESHLQELACGNKMQAEAAVAFSHLCQDASRAGFELAIASSFRSFDRQLAIWNGKVSGARPVYDDAGQSIMVAKLTPAQLIHAILRFSALPGTSRHHWGTDVDVYDLAAMGEGYCVQLSPREVATGGVFDPLHCWLDERMASHESHGFYRPYSRDIGGVAIERWHLSYAPISLACAGQLTSTSIRDCWNDCGSELLLRRELEGELPEIVRRYLTVEENWCPAS